jgi:WD40 repeat protein
VWDVSTTLNTGAATGRELLTLFGHTGIVFSVAFSPDGTRLATASTDSTVKVWNVSPTQGQREEPLTLYGHTGGILRAVFSPDGKRIATASRDGTTRVYALPIADIVAIAKTRVTRTLTTDECQKFLHEEKCPSQ